MKTNLLIFVNVLFSAFTFAQVGINEITPTATLDIKSKGNTNTTKALEVNNSSSAEMLTVLDNGNVGINTANPTAKLHTNRQVTYDNLPQITSGISPLAIDANGYFGTYVPLVIYSYMTTTQINQKIALFFQYASGELNQFTQDECYFNIPAGSIL